MMGQSWGNFEAILGQSPGAMLGQFLRAIRAYIEARLPIALAPARKIALQIALHGEKQLCPMHQCPHPIFEKLTPKKDKTMIDFSEQMQGYFDALPESEQQTLRQMIDGINSRQPGIFHTMIEHDISCPKLNGGECCCNPDVRFLTHEQFKKRYL